MISTFCLVIINTIFVLLGSDRLPSSDGTLPSANDGAFDEPGSSLIDW